MVRFISYRNLVAESGFLKVCIGYIDAYFVVFSNNLIVIRRLLSFGAALSCCFIQEFIAFSKAFCKETAQISNSVT